MNEVTAAMNEAITIVLDNLMLFHLRQAGCA